MKYSFRGISWNMKYLQKILLFQNLNFIAYICHQKKHTFWNLIVLRSICYSKNISKKKFKKTKTYMNQTMVEKQNDKSACYNIYLKLLLPEKFRHYPRMNATSYHRPYIGFYTFITYAFYITYTYNYETCIHYFIIYWFLKFTTVHIFHFYKNVFSITQSKECN